jgi:hypothetical protein
MRGKRDERTQTMMLCGRGKKGEKYFASATQLPFQKTMTNEEQCAIAIARSQLCWEEDMVLREESGGGWKVKIEVGRGRRRSNYSERGRQC